MSSDEFGLFRKLKPPPGGAERFRRRLEAQAMPARHAAGRRLVLAGLATVLIAAVLFAVYWQSNGVGRSGPGDGSPQMAGNAASPTMDLRSEPAFARLLGQAAPPTETTIAIDDEPVRVAEIPSANSKIRLYRVESN